MTDYKKLVNSIRVWRQIRPMLYEEAAMFDEAADAIEELLQRVESVRTNVSEIPTGWTSLSERPPEKNGRYLVTRGLKAAGSTWNRDYIANYSDLMGLKTERIFWEGTVGKNDFKKLDDVLAWQPLPEPYRGEEK